MIVSDGGSYSFDRDGSGEDGKTFQSCRKRTQNNNKC